jgi:hypothetical protein
MPYQSNLSLPSTVPNQQSLTLSGWRKGVITLLDKSRIPKDAAIEMSNLFLAENGVPTVRWGVDWFGTAPTSNQIDGAGFYTTSTGEVHILVAAGGSIYSSTNDAATWTVCTGGSVTAGKTVSFEQNLGKTYITTGVDNILRYNGTTTLEVYNSLSAPTWNSVTESGSSVMAGTGVKHYYKVAAVNEIGSSIGSAASTVVEASLVREQWTPATDFVDLKWDTVAGATRYDVFVSKDNVTFNYITSTVGNASTTLRDNGQAFENIMYQAPIQNTTQGPPVEVLTSIGERLWGVRDTQNPNRVWWSGQGVQSGFFAPAYNGGYIDIMAGTQYRPVKIEDYRDGKNEPYATVWMNSSDSQGAIWQIKLDVLTIENIYRVTVPVSVRLPGSRGTEAPGSVVNVLNDYHFYNSQAFYNLGSRAQFLNLLSTDEISANIRPTIKQINQAGAKNITAIYLDAKVFYSVPMGSSEVNNQTIVYDTERQAWNPRAFTIGFKKFLKFTQTVNGVKTQLLLAWKDGDTKLSKIDSSIQGDYGQPFTTTLVTGLYPMTNDRFEFMQIEDAEIEFSQPKGEISVELVGIERKNGYSSIKTINLSSSMISLNTGWSTSAWSVVPWSDNVGLPTVYSESSVKRYTRILRELNAFQWRVETNSLMANYLLRTLQLKGTQTVSGKPRTWRIQ